MMNGGIVSFNIGFLMMMERIKYRKGFALKCKGNIFALVESFESVLQGILFLIAGLNYVFLVHEELQLKWN